MIVILTVFGKQLHVFQLRSLVYTSLGLTLRPFAAVMEAHQKRSRGKCCGCDVFCMTPLTQIGNRGFGTFETSTHLLHQPGQHGINILVASKLLILMMRHQMPTQLEENAPFLRLETFSNAVFVFQSKRTAPTCFLLRSTAMP